jgi:lysine-specific demethylase 8
MQSYFNKSSKRFLRFFSDCFPRFTTVPVADSSSWEHKEWTALYESQTPTVLKGYAKEWSCVSDPLRKWSNLQQLKRRIEKEDSIVQIELGNHYMDPSVQKHRISLESYIDFLMKYEKEDKEGLLKVPKVYLAQHNVRDIAVMRDDLEFPSICKTGKGNLYGTNIWFSGPRGSISPCHYDPFQNILIQVFGEKEVWLINPKYSDNLYPAYGTVQKNTSLVDFENPDEDKFPRFFNIELQRADLQEGDALFMPFKWWHYCKTQSIACSVNYWWL